MPETNAESGISPLDHQPALFFIHPGITLSEPSPCSVGGIFIISLDMSH